MTASTDAIPSFPEDLADCLCAWGIGNVNRWPGYSGENEDERPRDLNKRSLR